MDFLIMVQEIDLKEVIFADLHIHSRFSRACSNQLTFENLVKWAEIKGLHLLGTGDFTHPIWFEEIKTKLFEKNGFYYYDDFPFIISGEISLIYTQGRGRRVHLVILVPSIEVAEKIHSYLDNKGRRDYDGRPIFKISCEEFVKDMKNISQDIEIIPAHIWTPYFGVFGSMGGFNSLREAFGSQVDNVHAIETGISSDPEMNWKIKELENKSIISFSDAHSFWPWRLGREATIFKKCESYSELIKQIRENNFVGTIETDPAYGKYHFDGHAKCDFSCSPEKTKELEGICPKCHGKLIIGVENRVEELTTSDKNKGKLFYKILPLHEIISLFLNVGINSKAVWNVYNNLIHNFKTEFNILLYVSQEELLNADVGPNLVELIIQNRDGEINVKPGYDGVYGVAEIGLVQKKLF
jgi:uncharacterized protein (TIGR00375 family)